MVEINQWLAPSTGSRRNCNHSNLCTKFAAFYRYWGAKNGD